MPYIRRSVFLNCVELGIAARHALAQADRTS